MSPCTLCGGAGEREVETHVGSEGCADGYRETCPGCNGAGVQAPGQMVVSIAHVVQELCRQRAATDLPWGDDL